MLSRESQAKLGDGAPIPWVGFGTYLCSDEQVSNSCTYALKTAGYLHIDTAEGYRTEAAVGKVLSELGIQPLVFVTTKLWPGVGDSVKNYDAVIQSAKDSRDKLGVPVIDLYLIHAPFAGPSGRIEQWRALVELQSRGVCKSIGVSNYSVAHLQEIEAAGLPKPAANQLEIHPLCQHKDIVEYCTAAGILVIAYSSLAPLSDWRPGQNSAKGKQQENAVFAALAAKYDVTTSQLLLRWALQHGFPILPKSNHPERMDLNLNLFDFSIETDDMLSLDALDENKCFAWPAGDPCLTP